MHVVQRGNNRGACFFSDSDRLAYLRYLGASTLETGCQVHAYCLMTNHVHLLLTPGSPDACARLMKQAGQLYVQHVNRVHGRTGTLWEGRYRSSVAASEFYVLACHRYIERNPVRACLVEHPRDYLWSSHRHNAEGWGDSLLTPHVAYLGLGNDLEQARRAYRELFDELSEPGMEDEIRSASRNGHAIGVQRRGRGRPQKDGDKNRDRPHISHIEK